MARCIIGLWKSKLSLPSHHLLNNNLSHPFISKISMNCQKVDFHQFYGFAVKYNFLGDTYDGSEDFLVFGVSDAKVELFKVSWTCAAPSELFL